MARPESISQSELVERLGAVFREVGFEGASLARLSKACGLAKAALYHRFPDGKEGMARSVLVEIGRQMTTRVLHALEGGAEPAERLAAMAGAVRDFYESGRRPCLADLFSISGTPQCLREPLAAGLAAWMKAIASVLMEAGLDETVAHARAEDAIVRIQGALVVSRALGDAGPFLRLVDRLADDLLAGAPAYEQKMPSKGERR